MNADNLLNLLAKNGLVMPHAGLLGGRLQFENPVFCGAILRTDVRLGAFSYALGSGKSEIWGPTTIGRYCSIAPGAIIGAPAHPTGHLSTHPFAFSASSFLRMFPEFRRIHTRDRDGGQVAGDVEIGNDVWLGQNVIILNGLRIGHGAIIAAGSVVTRNVEDYAIVGGVPARVIRKRFDPGIVDRLLALEWWNYDLAPVRDRIDYADIGNALALLEAAAAENSLPPLEARRHTAEKSNGQFLLDSRPLGAASGFV